MVLDINKILDSFEQEFYQDTPEDISPSPCYQAKFEDGNVTFLVDGKDIATYPIGTRSLLYKDIKATLCRCFDLLKENNIKELKRFWKK